MITSKNIIIKVDPCGPDEISGLPVHFLRFLQNKFLVRFSPTTNSCGPDRMPELPVHLLRFFQNKFMTGLVRRKKAR